MRRLLSLFAVATFALTLTACNSCGSCNQPNSCNTCNKPNTCNTCNTCNKPNPCNTCAKPSCNSCAR